MIDTKKPLERFLQVQRFQQVKPHIKGDVLDFGGNDGELKPLVSGEYTIVNYDHSAMEGKSFDSIISLAVVEHINVEEVYRIFHKFKKVLRPGGTIFLTTPTPMSKPVLEMLAAIGVLDKQNIEEHKHYWNKSDLQRLAEITGFKPVLYRKFQFGFNQYMKLEHA